MEPHQEDTPRPKRLLDQVRDAIRLKHYSIRTEQAYIGWITRYILFHHQRHPTDMGAAEIEAFLTHLAVDENVAASTQNQALSGLLFLYRDVLKKDLAVGISFRLSFDRPAFGDRPSSSSGREQPAKGGQAGCPPGTDRQTSWPTHLPTLLRHALAGGRL
jgi:hypothetical protein